VLDSRAQFGGEEGFESFQRGADFFGFASEIGESRD